MAGAEGERCTFTVNLGLRKAKQGYTQAVKARVTRWAYLEASIVLGTRRCESKLLADGEQGVCLPRG